MPTDGSIKWIQAAYILPHFSFGIVILDFFTAGAALALFGIKVAHAWVALVLSIPFYLGLYLYLDAIIPNEYGIARSCCFCLRREKRAQDEVQNEIIYSDVQNALSIASEPKIKITKLSKKFGKFQAVKDFSLNLNQNEVIALLGHNGAGKTTLINMLTGMITPSGGDATIYDHSLIKDIDKVRKSLGLCQQFDVLFEELTVRQHLKLACDLKDIEETEKEIDEVLD